MPAGTSAKPLRVNLLGQQDLAHTPWGRIVTWATSWGRYIMITTEIVVLLAFISRFSLDRKLTDLTEEITQKQAIIEANQPFEQEIRRIQDRLGQVKTLLKTQPLPVEVLTIITTILPTDVYIESLELINTKVQASVVAGSTAGFSQFLANLQATPQLTNVTVGEIVREPAIGLMFGFSAQLTNMAGTEK